MKTLKFLLQMTASVFVLFGASSCSNDDDVPSCQICTYTYNGQSYSEEVCPEDFDSQAQYEAYINLFEVSGGDCD